MRLIPRSWRGTVSEAAWISAILTFVVTFIASLGALASFVNTVSQWVASVAGIPVVADIALRVLHVAMSGYLAYRVSRLVRNELNAMQKQIDRQWLDNMDTHVHTQRLLGQVSEAVFAGNMQRGTDVLRLQVENQLQLILLMGIVTSADRASVLDDIAARRRMIAETFTDGNLRTAALEIIARYEALLAANALDE